MTTRGAISIEVVADTSKFAAELKRQLRAILRSIRTDPIEVDADTSPFIRRIREAQGEADKSFRGLFDTLKERAEKAGFDIGKALGVAIGPALVGALAPAVQGAVALLASIGPAALTALPAAIGAISTMKVALFGVGETLKQLIDGDLKKFEKALAKLSPTAQQFFRALQALGPQVSALKNAVQSRFFTGFNKDVVSVSKNLLGPLKIGMTGVAGDLNKLARLTAEYAASTKGSDAVVGIFRTTRQVIAEVSDAFGPLLEKLLDYVIAGTDAKSVDAAFVRAKATISGLAKVAGNLKDALGSVFSGSFNSDATSVVNTLIKGSAALKEFLASANAQAALQSLGSILKDSQGTLSQVLEILPKLLPALANLASGGFDVLSAAIGALLTAVKPFVDFLADNPQAARDLGVAIGTIVVAIKAYQAALVLATGAQIVWNGLVVAGNALMTTATVLWNAGRLAIALMGVAFTSAGAQATILGAALWGQVTAATAAIAGWVRIGAAAVASGAQQAAALAVATAGWIKLAVQQALATTRLIAYTVAMNAVRVATIAWTAVQWLLNVAMTANPIGIVIAVIVALVAAIVIAYQKSETFRSIVQAAFAGIAAAATWLWENALKPLWDGIVAGFEFVKAAAALWWVGVQLYFQLLAAAATTLWNWIKAAWNGIVAAFNFVVAGAASFVSSVVGFFQNLVGAVAGKISSMISFVTSIPGRIMSAVGNLGGLLYNAGANIIQGLINGISSMIGRLTGAVGNAVQKIRDFLPFSPAKVGPLSGSGAPEASGRKIATGIADGIMAEQSTITGAMNTMAGNLEATTPSLAARNPGGGAGEAGGGGIRVWPGQTQAASEPIVINSGGSKLDNLLVEILGKAIRVRGGIVQNVLGKAQGGVA